MKLKKIKISKLDNMEFISGGSNETLQPTQAPKVPKCINNSNDYIDPEEQN